MADENKVEEIGMIDMVKLNTPSAIEFHSRGELGVATASLTMKNRWLESGQKVSLKRFARELAMSGDKVAKEWFGNKHGKRNQKRSDKNMARVSLEKQASKAARRKVKANAKKPAADAAAAPAKTGAK